MRQGIIAICLFCSAFLAVPAAAGGEPEGGCAGTVLISPAQFQGATTLINFDVLPNGNPVLVGTPNLDDEWRDWGILIEDSSPPDGARAYNTTFGIPPHSAPVHIADGNAAGGTAGGFILFKFVVPGTNTPKAVLEAGLWIQNGDAVDEIEFFDCQGASICALESGIFQDKFIGVRYTSGISAIMVSSTDFYLCDDLQFGGTVTCGNQPPVIQQSNPQSLNVAKGSTCPGAPNQLALSATDPDGPVGSLSWSIQTQGTHGTASFVGGTTGGNVTVCYQPNPNQINPDSFLVRVQDAQGGIATLTVNTTVGNSAPTITQGDTANLNVQQNSTCPGAPNQLALSATDVNDPSGATLSWSVTTPPAHGAVTFVGPQTGPNVTVCYQPGSGLTTPVSFVVRVLDAWNSQDTITVNVTISTGGGPCNPGIKGDMILDGSLNGLDIGRFAQVLVNPAAATTSERCRADIGQPGEPCTPDGVVTIADLPGFVSLICSGTCNIAPFIGGGGGGGGNQIVGKNTDCPAASNEIHLTGTDPDGPASELTWSIPTPPATGTASFAGTPTGANVAICYEPMPGQMAPDSYVVEVEDEHGATGSLLVNVTVVNAAPVIDQGASIAGNVAVNSTCPGANNEFALSATDDDDAPVTLNWTISTPPATGQASFVGGSTGGGVTVCYQPNAGQAAADSFVVRVADPFGAADTITVNISVASDPPVITQGDSAPLSVVKNSSCPAAANQITLDATDPDGPPAAMNWSLASGPASGFVSFVGGTSGAQVTVCYQPNANQSAADSFVVRVTDQAGAIDQITINVTVTNTAPTIQGPDPTAMVVSPNSNCASPNNSIALSASDPDDPPASLNWSITPAPSLGQATVVGGTTGATFTVCYTPAPGQTQPDSFGVRVTDSSGATDSVTVNVTVQNAPPTITQGDTTSMNVPLNSFCPSVSNQINLTASDPDGPVGSLVWTVQTQPVTGAVSFVGGSSGGSVTICYAPNFDQIAPDSFVVRVTDAGGATDSITVQVTVVNAPPVIGQGDGPLFLQVAQNSTCPNVANQRNLSASDSDGLNSALAWNISAPPATGSVSFINGITTGPNVTVCYQPNAGQSAPDSFTVRVADQFGGVDTITIQVTVLP